MVADEPDRTDWLEVRPVRPTDIVFYAPHASHDAPLAQTASNGLTQGAHILTAEGASWCKRPHEILDENGRIWNQQSTYVAPDVHEPGIACWVSNYGESLVGKIVVDISNPVDWATFDRLVIPVDSSAAESIALLASPDTSVVKAEA